MLEKISLVRRDIGTTYKPGLIVFDFMSDIRHFHITTSLAFSTSYKQGFVLLLNRYAPAEEVKYYMCLFRVCFDWYLLQPRMT